jgi:DNA-binding NarL/FixJ family response regulator
LFECLPYRGPICFCMLCLRMSHEVLLADGVLGFSQVELALMGSLAAMIYAVTRWRRNTVNKSRMRTTGTDAHADRGAALARGASGQGAANPLSVREVTMEIQALLGDLEETARRLTAQLDNRYTRLEQLLAEADEKIQRLEGAAGSTGICGKGESSPLGKVTAQAAPAMTEAQRALTRLRQERGAPPAALDPAYQPIYGLADRGKSSREIAQELGRQPGEIELILALRKRGG